MEVSGNYAYVADEHQGLRIINVSNPATPTEVGFSGTGGYAEDVEVSGNYAYVATGGRGLRIIDVSNPAAPVQTGFYDTPGDALGVAVSGSYAYVADGPAGLTIVRACGTGGPQYSNVYWLPVASRASGLSGTQWRTDLGLLNLSGSEARVELRFYGRSGLRSNTVLVANGAQSILVDVVGQMGVSSDSGALEIRSDQPLRVTSRTYNQGASGTYGQNIDAYAEGGGLGAGQTAWLPQLTENQAYRCNIAVTNTGSVPATVTVTLYDGSGAQLASYTYRDMQPGEWRQERAFYDRGYTSLSRAYAKVTVGSGSGVVAYASVVDNVTGDATTIRMMP
ncbi:hypothetical protein HRbin09_00806 [bacterium HR09]|nr:hypothetical protein HRbin09_00806 [bacterium HR09]